MKTLLMSFMFFLGTFSLLEAKARDLPKLIGSTVLLNQEGKEFQLKNTPYKGNYIFISFVFTRCPMKEMCPLTMTLKRGLIDKWKTLKPRPALKFLAVTLDPEHDKPKVIKAYSMNRGFDFTDFTFATGSRARLSDFTSYFNIFAVPGEGLIAHSIRSVLLDPNLKLIKTYDDNKWSAKQVLADLKKHKKTK
jgi:protein SCO1/2